MDRDFAIERHRGRLLGHIMGLFVLIGLTEGGMVERLSKPLYRKVLSILRPAESAVRRLIIIAARDIVVEPRKPRPPRSERKKPGESKSNSEGQEKGKTKRKRGFFFRLFDPPKRERRTYRRRPRRPQPDPRAYYLDVAPGPQSQIFLLVPQPQLPPAPPVVKEKADDGTVNARHLCRRLFAMVDALRDIPRQALRYARWRDTPIEDRHPQRESALRFGRPPGFRQRSKHEVDEILKECHWLVRSLEPQLHYDTS